MTHQRYLPASVRLGRLAGAAAVCLALAACSTGSELPGPAASGDPGPGPAPTSESGQDAGTDTAEAESAVKVSERKVRAELEDLAGATPKPTSEQMVAALTKAGFKKSAVEVSADITPTGLAVDAIEAAAPVDGDCIVGQVRDGKVAISVLPVLDSGKCFVGGAA